MLNQFRYTGFAVVMVFIAVLALFIPVFADDAGPGITATVNIVGNNPDANVNLYGSNPDVWINGAALDQLAGYFGAQAGAQAGGSVASAALQNSAPNSTYSSVGTGMLPVPNITSDGRVAAIDSPDTKWVPGWQGFFCPKTNLDPMVYHGSGCGGTWGVCDGAADLWARRQLAGLAPEFRQTQNKLETSYVALAKLIAVSQEQNGSIVNVNQALQDHLAQLSILSTDLAMLEKQHQALKAEVMQQREESDRKMLILAIIFGAGMLAMGGYLIALTRRYRTPAFSVEQKGLFSRVAAMIRSARPGKVAEERKGLFIRRIA